MEEFDADDEVGHAPDRADRQVSHARVRLPITALQLPTPPVDIKLRFMVRNNQLAIIVQFPTPASESIQGWIDQMEPDHSFSHHGETSETRWLSFEPIPRHWAELVSLFELRHIEASPDGTATVALTGSRQHIKGLIDEIGTADLLGVTSAPDDSSVLTDRQEEALRTAAQEGYYEVPRRTSLRELAKKLDLSASSVSELLRRAEGEIIQAYFGTAGRATEAGFVEGETAVEST